MKINRRPKIIIYVSILACIVVAVLVYLATPHIFQNISRVPRGSQSGTATQGPGIDAPVSRAAKEGWTPTQTEHLGPVLIPVSEAVEKGWTLVETNDLGAVLYDIKTLQKRKDGSATVLTKEIYSEKGHKGLGLRLGGTQYGLVLMSFDCGSWEKATLNMKYAAVDDSILYDSADYNKSKRRPPQYTPIDEGTIDEKIANAVCARCPERPRGSAKKRYVEPRVPEKLSWSPDTMCEKLKETGSTASFDVQIGKNLPKYKFTITGTFIKEDVFNPTRVDVTDTSTGRRIQRIKAGKHFGKGFASPSELYDLPCPVLQFVDLNYDGYLDMRILIDLGATGLDWYATYLYNPGSRKYVYHETLSQLSYVTLDPMNKRIISYERGGSCAECRGHIKVQRDGRLVLKKIEWTDPGRDKLDNIICHSVTAVARKGVTVYLDKKSLVCPIDEKDMRPFKKKFKIVSRDLMDGSLDDRARSPMGNPME